MEAFEDISLICRRFGSSRPQEASDHTFAYNAEFQTGKSFLHGELVGLGTYVMACLQDNDPGFLLDAYAEDRTAVAAPRHRADARRVRPDSAHVERLPEELRPSLLDPG